ncbi:mycofactocin-coupled SDR family oxidoreductase [Arthrobacter gandavensis]|uniref:mycofactocin-coupled SDR family oxidoreductase n=1 Tax=Arthrobacter gandavensis TaxID=169960 RepID=UPI00188EF2EB|nr:mycofactocin-coupled SDR family oxidoreductase [Arthrobacter gandavensis]MBF4994417.1 mycofactocin-coupled SDR family oxidoreductase [Arthrobacter gandavensis]
MGKLDGKVAFITGAARGQGRSHALKLAEEGADIIAVDICSQIASVEYDMATPEDLDETVRLVEALDRRIFAQQADVRDLAALEKAVQEGEAAIGPVDIILANAGIAPLGLNGDREQPFADVVDVNLTGVYNTVIAAVPSLIAKQAGSIVLTSSTQGLKGTGGSGGAGGTGYAAAKHGVVGLMRSFANWLSPQNIRVNSIHPTGVATPMIQNPIIEQLFAENPDSGDAVKNLMPVPWVEPRDISNAIAFLVSDDARYITGVTLPVDAGFNAR